MKKLNLKESMLNDVNSTVEETKDEKEKASNKSQKPRNLFFGGVSYIADASLMERLQADLDKALPDAFNVTEVNISKNEISIKIERGLKDFFEPQAGCISYDDANLMSGRVQEASHRLPLCPGPFAAFMHISYGLDDVRTEYNGLMKKRDRIKDIAVDTTPSYVKYSFKY